MQAILSERTRVRMLSAVSGLKMPQYGITAPFAYAQDENVELDPKLAKVWSACGYVEVLKEDKK